NKNLIAGIVGVVAVTALVIVLISSCGGGSPESMAVDFYTAVLEGDGDELWNAMNTDAFIDILVDADQIDEDDADDIKDNCIDEFDDTCQDIQRECKKQFGKDFSYEIEVTKVKDLKSSDLRDFENRINGEDSDIEVTEGVAVTLKISISGDDDDTLKETLNFYKVDGEWFWDNIIYYLK
ncbi:MAG: hypothetical protein KIG31_05040, partial [Oscillospiraceae bacterium]|nr:hypothetical protein [Oscillospiraceae bacterium]